MARGSAGSLLVPLALAILIAILLYFYWGASSELHGLRKMKDGLSNDVLAARNERDNLQYRLNLLKEDLDSTTRKKEELERSLKEGMENRRSLEDRLAGFEQNVQDSEEQIKDLEEANAQVQNEVDDCKAKLSSCEASKSQLESINQGNATTQLQQQNSLLRSNVQTLQQEKEELDSEFGALEAQLKDVKGQLNTCLQARKQDQAAVPNPVPNRQTLEDTVLKQLQEEKRIVGNQNAANGQPDAPDLVDA